MSRRNTSRKKALAILFLCLSGQACSASTTLCASRNFRPCSRTSIFRKIKREMELVRSGTYDDKIKDMWEALQECVCFENQLVCRSSCNSFPALLNFRFDLLQAKSDAPRDRSADNGGRLSEQTQRSRLVFTTKTELRGERRVGFFSGEVWRN